MWCVTLRQTRRLVPHRYVVDVCTCTGTPCMSRRPLGKNAKRGRLVRTTDPHGGEVTRVTRGCQLSLHCGKLGGAVERGRAAGDAEQEREEPSSSIAQQRHFSGPLMPRLKACGVKTLLEASQVETLQPPTRELDSHLE